MHLLIKTLNETAKSLYSNHGHFHDGDAGLDLYVLEEITILAGETKLLKLAFIKASTAFLLLVVTIHCFILLWLNSVTRRFTPLLNGTLPEITN